MPKKSMSLLLLGQCCMREISCFTGSRHTQLRQSAKKGKIKRLENSMKSSDSSQWREKVTPIRVVDD